MPNRVSLPGVPRMTDGGVFPVRRGYRDDEAFVTANSILERGGLIVMYSEGGRSRTGKLAEQPLSLIHI